MKPAWDELTAEFKDSKTSLIADVDCDSAGGKALCASMGVRGYPTIRYGSPDNLKDYEGKRDLNSLKKFAEENLGPTCGPAHIDLCDDAKKADIEKFSKMSEPALQSLLLLQKQAMDKVEEDFLVVSRSLKKKERMLFGEKENKVAAIKEKGVGLMEAVLQQKNAAKAEL